MKCALAAAFIVLAALTYEGYRSAEAQTPTPAPPGSVTGTVKNGTQGFTSVDGVRVQLLAVGSDGQVTSQEAPVEDGRFSFTPPASSTVTYVLRASYRDVSYLVDPPILLSPELPNDQRDITVYETTNEAPDLNIDSTVVSMQGLDRAQTQLTLQREDQVVNSSDRVYVGGDDRVTYRVPALEGIVQLQDSNSVDSGEVKLDGGSVTTTQPIKPGTNLIVTRYVVGYDQASDAYRLRVTAPLPSRHMEIWVPGRFVDDIEPGPDALQAADRDLQQERWHVIQRRDPAGEGESLTATVEGLTGANTANPLTQFPGAAIAAVLAIGAVTAGAVLLDRLRPHRRNEAAL